jgi:hypothetical protein
VLRKINDNSYEIDLPSSYGVSTSFNVVDLSPYFGPEESSTTPFQEGEDDEDITTIRNPDALVTPDASQVTPSPPLLRIKNQVHNRLCKIKHWIHKPKFMKVQLRIAVQRKSNKRCMLSSLSYVVILMRVIYYLSLVVLHKRLIHWIMWRTHKVTWKTPRLLPS